MPGSLEDMVQEVFDAYIGTAKSIDEFIQSEKAMKKF